MTHFSLESATMKNRTNNLSQAKETQSYKKIIVIRTNLVIVRFQVLTAASMVFRVVFWDILPCKMIVDRRFRGAYCLHHQGYCFESEAASNEK
jgi:hypothetical protein